MFTKFFTRYIYLPLLLAMLALSSCGPNIQNDPSDAMIPTPEIAVEQSGMEVPKGFTDPIAFQSTLLETISAGDTTKLQAWMTESFLTGTWRGDLIETNPVEALKTLPSVQAGSDNPLTLVKDADLITLMGGKNPLSIQTGESSVTDAFLVGGWGE